MPKFATSKNLGAVSITKEDLKRIILRCQEILPEADLDVRITTSNWDRLQDIEINQLESIQDELGIKDLDFSFHLSDLAADKSYYFSIDFREDTRIYASGEQQWAYGVLGQLNDILRPFRRPYRNALGSWPVLIVGSFLIGLIASRVATEWSGSQSPLYGAFGGLGFYLFLTAIAYAIRRLYPPFDLFPERRSPLLRGHLPALFITAGGTLLATIAWYAFSAFIGYLNDR